MISKVLELGACIHRGTWRDIPLVGHLREGKNFSFREIYNEKFERCVKKVL
jgi:hypothetical protein